MINLTYDGLNQLKETIQVSSDNTKSLGYKYGYRNPFGYVDEQSYKNGIFQAQTHYYYNASGQITQKNVLGNIMNSNVSYQYDEAGRVTSVGVGVQDNNYRYTNYKYTKDRITQVQTNGLKAENNSDTNNAAYEYYPDGKLKKITYPKLNDNSLLTTEYLYNALGLLTSVTNKKGSSVLSQFAYSYDANGNITSVNDGQSIKTYTYDKLNRLLEVMP